MIPRYVDVDNSHVIVKLIDGTEVWAQSIDKKTAEKDFELKINDNCLLLYQPIIFDSEYKELEDKKGQYVEYKYLPKRYFNYDANPFMEIALDKILMISNLDEDSENHYSVCVEYLDLNDFVAFEELEVVTGYLIDQIKEAIKKSNLEQLEELDEKLVTKH